VRNRFSNRSLFDRKRRQAVGRALGRCGEVSGGRGRVICIRRPSRCLRAANLLRSDSVVMPITFPDGTTAELVYPRPLNMSDLRVQPYSSGYGPGFARDFLVFDKPLAEVIGSYEDAERLAEYEDGHGGSVGFWRLPPDGAPPRVPVRFLDGARLRLRRGRGSDER
jgi:hypothetical protein